MLMATTTSTSKKRTKGLTTLTRAERVVLARLSRCEGATRQADYANDKMVQNRRGTFLEKGTCVVYSNDGFSSDIRAMRAVVLVAQRIEAMGHEIEGFGIGGEGRSWVLVVRFVFGTLKRKRECLEWEFSSIVSAAWTDVSGYGPGSAIQTHRTHK
jgi:hypothetical protein